MGGGNLLLLYVPSLPLWSILAVAFAARNSAIYFTEWYPRSISSRLSTVRPPAALPDAPAEQD